MSKSTHGSGAVIGGVSRIDARFADLKAENRAGLVTYVMAGDPDMENSKAILAGLPAAGADIIELGMPFTDPMADGPSVQVAGLRSLKAGTKLTQILDMVRDFRKSDTATPIILMGYYNPLHLYGVPQFLDDALAAGIDGLIIVDLPPEEDEELCLPTLAAGMSFIRLATPTTDDHRLRQVLSNTSGFVYYVSYTGITGARVIDTDAVAKAVKRLKSHSALPVGVGFGIRTPEQAAAVAEVADAVVVGSAFVDAVGDHLDANGDATAETIPAVLSVVAKLAAGVQSAARAKS